MKTEDKGPETEPANKKRFLVLVDGNPIDLLSIGMLLQKIEYDIYTSNSAEEALQIISAVLPALVITELTLPGMNGLDFLRRIKQHPATKKIPVIILTSLNKPDIEKLCVREGCAAYLRKPFEADTLYREIQNATEPTPRKYIRLRTNLTMISGQGTAKESSSVECITDVSENGMYISTLNPLPVGTVIPVSMVLNKQQVRIEGVVMYSFSAGHGPLKRPGMGIKFINISPEGKALLRKYIQEQLREGILPEKGGGTR